MRNVLIQLYTMRGMAGTREKRRDSTVRSRMKRQALTRCTPRCLCPRFFMQSAPPMNMHAHAGHRREWPPCRKRVQRKAPSPWNLDKDPHHPCADRHSQHLRHTLHPLSLRPIRTLFSLLLLYKCVVWLPCFLWLGLYWRPNQLRASTHSSSIHLSFHPLVPPPRTKVPQRSDRQGARDGAFQVLRQALGSERRRLWFHRHYRNKGLLTIVQ